MAGGGPRWSDRVAIGALTQTYPPALVDEVLAQTGRREQRTRLLPARMVVYYLLALALFADVAYLEVLRLLTEALRRPSRRGRGGPMRLPVKSALIQARARLGPAPLKALFDQAAVPLATPTTLGAWYRGWRLLALDGTCAAAASAAARLPPRGQTQDMQLQAQTPCPPVLAPAHPTRHPSHRPPPPTGLRDSADRCASLTSRVFRVMDSSSNFCKQPSS
jgi:hypothetical protein